MQRMKLSTVMSVMSHACVAVALCNIVFKSGIFLALCFIALVLCEYTYCIILLQTPENRGPTLLRLRVLLVAQVWLILQFQIFSYREDLVIVNSRHETAIGSAMYFCGALPFLLSDTGFALSRITVVDVCWLIAAATHWAFVFRFHDTIVD